MARCVLIVDSETGKLIDAAGNVREGGRYRKFVSRMLSSDKNPVLDYGANGGDKLEISNGGYPGAEVNIKARVLTISGDLRVNGNTIAGSGKLDSTAAYPEWSSETAYSEGDKVSHVGRIWVSESQNSGSEPSEGSEDWTDTTLGEIINSVVGNINAVLDTINGEVI